MLRHRTDEVAHHHHKNNFVLGRKSTLSSQGLVARPKALM